MDGDRYVRLFESVITGKKWIVAVDVAAVAGGQVEWLKKHGADDVFVIAGSPGTGDPPDLPSEHVALLNVVGDGMMDGIRRFHDAIHRPLPLEVQRQLDTWDPAGEAHVFANFLDSDLPVGGRRQFGARPEAWTRLEDKTTVDEMWDALAVPRAPSIITALTVEAVTDAFHTLNAGVGVVVTGDNASGWHGGAEYSRIARTAADVHQAVAALAGACRTARIMPFLEGVPCGIHGLVFPNHVATVRPVEMIVFVEPERGRFRYASVSSYWNPPASDAEAMRHIARLVGDHLRHEIGYRGAFTIDGVMTDAGFRPTELNPRAGAGLGAVIDTPPPFALHTMLVAGVEFDWQPEKLQAHWRAAGYRRAGGYTMTEVRVTTTEQVRVRFEGGTWQVSDADPQGTLTLGPAAGGGLVRIRFDDDVIAPGQLAAPVVASAFALADELWDTGLGKLVPARDLRP